MFDDTEFDDGDDFEMGKSGKKDEFGSQRTN